MTNELLFSHLFIIGVIGLISGSISFLVIKALTKNTTVSGALSIVLGVIISVVYFFFTLSDILNSYSQEFINSAIEVVIYHRLDLCLTWVIGTLIFWISTKKHENTKTKKSKQ